MFAIQTVSAVCLPHQVLMRQNVFWKAEAKKNNTQGEGAVVSGKKKQKTKNKSEFYVFPWAFTVK